MEIKARDIYRIKVDFSLSFHQISALYSLYQPIIGTDAVALYMTLLSEGSSQKVGESHNRLCVIMNRSMTQVESARKQLEQFLLLKTYIKVEENRTNVAYEMFAPLNGRTFLGQEGYRRLLSQALGQKQYELTMSKWLNESKIKEGYTDISESPRSLDNVADIETTSFELVRMADQFDDTQISFDYETFLSTTSPLVFPNEVRTAENLRLIGQMATLYGVSVDRMRIQVGRFTDYKNRTFDQNGFRYSFYRMNQLETFGKEGYDLPPVSFLQSKQNGAMVTVVDRKLLDHLAVDMKFRNDVINVLIEYVLQINNNKLTNSFVDKIAGEWSRVPITTREEALAYIESKKKEPAKGVRKASLPDYYETRQKGEDNADNGLSEDERAAMIRQIKEFR